MRILVVGYGAREHAIIWKLHQSSQVTEIFAASGNPGIAKLATCVPIDAPNVIELADFASSVNINFTVVGPEVALDLGIVDEFQKRDLLIFGPTNAAAEIETSKVFAKDFMRERNIPTARFRIANSFDEARNILQSDEFSFPVVLKADGLAAGKGVMICRERDEVHRALETMMLERRFGKSGDRIVIEEFLEGEEVSFHVISDGKRVLPLATSQDHKRLLEGDLGANTGGMGAYSPAAHIVNQEIWHEVMDRIILPTISGLAEEGRPYQGVLYAGLMITNSGPKVLEFNARFGDPETQCLMTRIDCDLVEVLLAAAHGTLEQSYVGWTKDKSICVVLASQGYPGNIKTGDEITGIENAEAMENVVVFHAGTELKDGKLVTSGGRVLSVTATHPHLSGAIELAYDAVSKIHFDGMQVRRDIGKRALEHNRT